MVLNFATTSDKVDGILKNGLKGDNLLFEDVLAPIAAYEKYLKLSPEKRKKECPVYLSIHISKEKYSSMLPCPEWLAEAEPEKIENYKASNHSIKHYKEHLDEYAKFAYGSLVSCHRVIYRGDIEPCYIVSNQTDYKGLTALLDIRLKDIYEAGWDSQKEIAMKLGMSYEEISRCNGEGNLNKVILRQIALIEFEYDG